MKPDPGIGSEEAFEVAGYVPGWHGEPVSVGQTAVTYSRGGWRAGRVTKVTPRYVYTEVRTPTSPDLFTVGKGSRDGSRTDLYVPAPAPRAVELPSLAPGEDPRPSALIATAMTKVEAEIASVVSPDTAYVVQSRAVLDGTHGVVLVRRSTRWQPYVVWYWAVALTDGSPVQTPTGAMLWQGSYVETYEEAVEVFGSRSIR